MASEPKIRLRRALERRIHAGHPWIYRDALERFEAAPGDPVTVQSRGGRFLARGLADRGPIAVRVFTTMREDLDRSLWKRRFEQAAQLRDRIRPPDTNAYRLVHGEGDRLPGCVVDVYGAVAVLRLDGAFLEPWQERISTWLRPTLQTRGIETLYCRTGRRATLRVEKLWGPETNDPVPVQEHGMTLLAPVQHGQKTGLFLDHRESRHRTRGLTEGLRVLNLYAYTGGFSVAAALGGAEHVTSVDIAAPALATAEQTWTANDLPNDRHRVVSEDVPKYLQGLKNHEPFGLIIADPPNFAPNQRSLEAALESYRKLHTRCFELLRPGGLYLAASCSSHVTRSAFEETLRDGAQQARRVVQALQRWGAPPDHPRLAVFPEGDYLKVTLLRVVD